MNNAISGPSGSFWTRGAWSASEYREWIQRESYSNVLEPVEDKMEPMNFMG